MNFVRYRGPVRLIHIVMNVCDQGLCCRNAQRAGLQGQVMLKTVSVAVALWLSVSGCLGDQKENWSQEENADVQKPQGSVSGYLEAYK